MESRRVVDLLPVRTADSFADWLRGHPEVRVITRDRSTLYADGGRQGAPTAVQLLDRYHLVSNLSDAVERDVQQMQIQARAALRQQMAPNSEPMRLTLVEARRQRCREPRYQRTWLWRIRFTAQFAKTLQRDEAEVQPAVAMRWNNGPLEGHVNRLKMIKRQMYGRAGFHLLKARVLPW
jgi:transposase